MKKFILVFLFPFFANANNSPVIWSGSSIAQFLPTIVKALLGNGFALLPSKSLVGDCSDGNVTISSGTTTLTRDVYYNNLTLSGTGILSVQNQRIYVCGTLDLTAAAAGAIFGSGGNGGNGAAATTAGTAGATMGAGSNIAGRTGGAGGAGGLTTGTQGATGATGNVVSCITGSNGSGGNGAAGGSGTSGAGGVVRNASVCAAWPMRDITTWFLPQTGTAAQVFAAGSGSGGSGGGGDTTNAGGGGGGGGAAGSSIYISAGIIKTGGSTPASVIISNGGNGGNGGSPTVGNTGGGGGGGAGAGGWIVVKWNSRSGAAVANALSAAAGTSGTGGTGHGTGNNGNNGGSVAPQPGLIQTLDYATGTITTTTTGSASL